MSTIDLPKSAPRRSGRRPSVNREDLLAAALTLVGPNRSVSTLSLREVTREAGIAPNSFYRHFKDMDDLAVALIDLAGRSLRGIIGEARQQASKERSIVRSSVEIFLAQLGADEKYLHILMREGSAGSPAFKQAVERELRYFETELCRDLERLAGARGAPLHQPALLARAITRLIFAIGKSAVDQPAEARAKIGDEMVLMIRMLITGSNVMAGHLPSQPRGRD